MQILVDNILPAAVHPWADSGPPNASIKDVVRRSRQALELTHQHSFSSTQSFVQEQPLVSLSELYINARVAPRLFPIPRQLTLSNSHSLPSRTAQDKQQAKMQLKDLLITAVAALPLAAAQTAVNQTTVTSVVTAITTWCPGPTTLTHGTRTYTVTKATTLTITDCPCTVTSVSLRPPTPTKPLLRSPHPPFVRQARQN